jgi:Na+/pantothenate symporter
MVTWVLLVFVAGSADRVYVLLGITYESQLWVYRVLVLVFPFVAGFAAAHVCRELQRGEVVERERHRAEAEAQELPAA